MGQLSSRGFAAGDELMQEVTLLLTQFHLVLLITSLHGSLLEPLVIHIPFKDTISYSSGYCSDLAQGRWRGQQGQTLAERIEMLGHPGSEKGGQAHAGLRAFGTACAAADFASDDQRAHTALGQIVVRRNPRHGHEDKEFG